MLVHRLIHQAYRGLQPSTSPLYNKICATTHLHRRHYAKGTTVGIPSLGKKPSKLKGAGGPVMEKKVLPVETDTNKLLTHLCGSCVYKTGEDVKLGEDSEYPDWLWELNTGKPLPVEELDPDTEYYWKRVRTLAMRRSLRLQKLKKF